MKQNQIMSSLSVSRSAFAYEEVSKLENAPWKKQMVNLIKGLPIAIRVQGLCVTLAILMAGQFYEKDLADLISRWILEESPRKSMEHQKSGKMDKSFSQSLLEICMKSDRHTYLAAQNEAFIICEQLKIYSNALYGKEIS